MESGQKNEMVGIFRGRTPEDCFLASILNTAVIEVLHDPGILLLGMYLKKTKTSNSKRHMHLSVHSSTIYNCQD